MRNLRWLALAPAALGVVLLFFTLLWTEWAWLGWVALLAVASVVIWRVAAGSWPKLSVRAK